MSHFEDAAAANRAPLDWVNFLLADVQGGVGPFLAVFLTSSQHWQAGADHVCVQAVGPTLQPDERLLALLAPR